MAAGCGVTTPPLIPADCSIRSRLISEHVWKWFPKNTARGIALVGFMAWLFWHFVSGEV